MHLLHHNKLQIKQTIYCLKKHYIGRQFDDFKIEIANSAYWQLEESDLFTVGDKLYRHADKGIRAYLYCAVNQFNCITELEFFYR